MPDRSVRVLIVGGYGVFGERLARLLADEPDTTIFIAGRSKSKAEALCARIDARAELLPVLFDRDGDVVATIGSLAPDIVVDAAGPFQNYGEDPYRIARASLLCSADYIDLADAPEFVAGVSQLDSIARERSRFAISGASTCPALTAAVVRHLAEGLVRVTAIEAGIAPSPRVQIGLSVMRALTSYAGRTLRILDHGKEADAVALVNSRCHVIAPAGVKPLSCRLFSLVDVPDLKLLPLARPTLESVWFGAGTAPVVLHRMFVLLARLSSIRILPSIGPLARLLHWARRVTWGEHRGGMYVVLDGCRLDGTSVRHEWSLIAEGDDGPFIPAMAAAALIRKSLLGLRVKAGARTAFNELEYADFEYYFAQKRITASAT